ncbi:hypothetical protein Ahy_B06g084474 [Arachis hypogaea]|uniref:Transposase MuDR plant domain-containing protein n=1 Tax=Arachis hypogaea TaxID=3818 RepID=A0A444YRZ3_ARAHY|nr:hypothetical protein Ahy_B06g084474 [Arachis hypogaea]
MDEQVGDFSDSYETEDIDSYEGDSDDMINKKRFPKYNEVEMCREYEFKVGLEFKSLFQFKDGIKEHALLNERDIRVVCKEQKEKCKWMCFASKVGGSDYFQIIGSPTAGSSAANDSPGAGSDAPTTGAAIRGKGRGRGMGLDRGRSRGRATPPHQPTRPNPIVTDYCNCCFMKCCLVLFDIASALEPTTAAAGSGATNGSPAAGSSAANDSPGAGSGASTRRAAVKPPPSNPIETNIVPPTTLNLFSAQLATFHALLHTLATQPTPSIGPLTQPTPPIIPLLLDRIQLNTASSYTSIYFSNFHIQLLCVNAQSIYRSFLYISIPDFTLYLTKGML